MKNVLVTTIIAASLIAGPVTAQQASRPLLTDNMQSLQTNTRYINKIHVKAMRDFLKRDKTAANADWMIVENGFVVKYTDKNNSRCRSVYNCRGEFSYTVKQYYESNMLRDVRALVKSHYYDYTITLVEEIEQPLKPVVYVVHMEDATTLKNIRVSERDIEVIEEYKKA
jgi:Ni/Co efflux regulator RcnB